MKDVRSFHSFYVTWGGRRRLLVELDRNIDWGWDLRLGYRAHHWTLSYRLKVKEDT